MKTLNLIACGMCLGSVIYQLAFHNYGITIVTLLIGCFNLWVGLRK